MIINDNFRDNLISLYNSIDLLLDNSSLTNTQIEKFIRTFEKSRYNILNEIKIHNKTANYDYDKIKTIDDNYTAKLENKILKIYVPEVMPSYKNLKTHTYKRILLNVERVTKPFANLFKNEIFIYIKVFNNIQGWDIDNKCVKPIADALIYSDVIKDDNISKMFYCVKGEYSENPHTEIYVAEGKNIVNYMEKSLI